jgi:hypothetical protein
MDEMASSNLSLKELIPALTCPAENPIIFRAIAEFDRNPIQRRTKPDRRRSGPWRLGGRPKKSMQRK